MRNREVNLDNIIIRKLSELDDLEVITILIRDAYKSLLDKGFRYWGTFQSVQDTAKRFSEGDAFVVEQNGLQKGAVKFHKRPRDPPAPKEGVRGVHRRARRAGGLLLRCAAVRGERGGECGGERSP